MYPYCTPPTKEAYWYRQLFCEIFGENRQKVIPGFWQHKWNKNGEEVKEYVDPSARTLEVYQAVSSSNEAVSPNEANEANPSTDAANPIDS